MLHLARVSIVSSYELLVNFTRRVGKTKGGSSEDAETMHILPNGSNIRRFDTATWKTVFPIFLYENQTNF